MRPLLLVLLAFGVSTLAARAQPRAKEKESAVLGPAEDIGKLIPVFVGPGHTTPVIGVFFTPDGKRLVSVESGGIVHVRDAATGERLKVWHLPAGVNGDRTPHVVAAALAADGRTLALRRRTPVAVSDAQVARVTLLDVESGAVRALPDPAGLGSKLFFDRAGASLFVVGESYLDVYAGMKEVWAKPFAEVLKQAPARTVPASAIGGKTIEPCALSPDEKTLALGCVPYRGERKMANLVDFREPAPGGQPAMPVTLAKQLLILDSLAWSPDCKQVAAGLSEEVRLFGADGTAAPALGRRKLGNAPGANMRVNYVHFLSATELFVVWHTWSSKPGVLRGAVVVNLSDPKRTRTLLIKSAPQVDVAAVAVSADGRAAAFTHGSYGMAVSVVDLATGKERFAVDGTGDAPTAVAWSKDGDAIYWNRGGVAGPPDRGVNVAKMESVRLDEVARLVAKDDRKAATVELRKVALFREATNGVITITPENNNQVGQLETADKKKIRLGGYLLEKREAIAFTVSADPEKYPWFAVNSTQGLARGNPANGNRVFNYGLKGQGTNCVTSSPDGRFLVASSRYPALAVFNADRPGFLLRVFAAGDEWVVFADNGYYAASPNGDKLFGWIVTDSPERAARFVPATQLRDRMHRPHVIQLILKHGSVEEALKEAKLGRVDLEKQLPPTARLAVTPKGGGAFEVEATAAATPGSTERVAALHLLFDGRPVLLAPGRFASQSFTPPVAETKPPVRWTVNLPPDAAGKLTVRVHSVDSYAFSNEVAVAPAAPPARKKGTMYYVGVGVGEYAADAGETNPHYKLDWCEKDVTNVAACLKAEVVPRSRYAAFDPTPPAHRQGGDPRRRPRPARPVEGQAQARGPAGRPVLLPREEGREGGRPVPAAARLEPRRHEEDRDLRG